MWDLLSGRVLPSLAQYNIYTCRVSCTDQYEACFTPPINTVLLLYLKGMTYIGSETHIIKIIQLPSGIIHIVTLTSLHTPVMKQVMVITKNLSVHDP